MYYERDGLNDDKGKEEKVGIKGVVFKGTYVGGWWWWESDY